MNFEFYTIIPILYFKTQFRIIVIICIILSYKLDQILNLFLNFQLKYGMGEYLNWSTEEVCLHLEQKDLGDLRQKIVG